MPVRVLSVSGMPFNIKVWVDDRDDGQFTVYVDKTLIQDDGAQALERVLSSSIADGQRLNDTMVFRTLRAVTR